MIDNKERRQTLADFLRSRRERLTPAMVGLPDTARRRTPGLRREELAQLAGISTAWYTALEQARTIHPSAEVLECLAKALQLTQTEQNHLFTLAQQKMLSDQADISESASPELRKFIHSLDPQPAYIIGKRWDLIDWNRSAELVFNFEALEAPYSRNLVWWFFTSAMMKQNENWEYITRTIVARFRTDSARYPGDLSFQELIDDLSQISDEFCVWWSQHNVESIEHRRKEINHPQLGELQFDQIVLQVPDNPDLRTFIYLPTQTTLIQLKQIVS